MGDKEKSDITYTVIIGESSRLMLLRSLEFAKAGLGLQFGDWEHYESWVASYNNLIEKFESPKDESNLS